MFFKEGSIKVGGILQKQPLDMPYKKDVFKNRKSTVLEPLFLIKLQALLVNCLSINNCFECSCLKLLHVET